MSAAPNIRDAGRLERAFTRLHAHCELVGRMTTEESRRVEIRERLERELGPDLTARLLASLVAPPA